MVDHHILYFIYRHFTKIWKISERWILIYTSMRHLLFIFLIFVSLGISSQTIGRIKQQKNQQRLQKISKNTWHFHPTRPGKLQNHRREGRNLFTGSTTSNKRRKDRIQHRINAYRFKHRIRGNEVFHKRKYKRV